MPLVVKPDAISKLPDLEFAPSSWFEISQQRVNQFADVSNDHQFIHVDPEKAAQTPFGGTIAHGFLTLSLLPALLAENGVKVEGALMAINYGSDRVRFLQPVPVGCRIRAHQKIKQATERLPGKWILKTTVSVEIEHQKKPALMANLLTMLVLN